MDDFRQDPPSDGAPQVRDLAGILHKSAQLVSALLESASQAIISIDRGGRIVLANPRAEEIFGYTREEMLGAPVEMLLPDAKRAAHSRDRADYFARPRSRSM